MLNKFKFQRPKVLTNYSLRPHHLQALLKFYKILRNPLLFPRNPKLMQEITKIFQIIKIQNFSSFSHMRKTTNQLSTTASNQQ